MELEEFSNSSSWISTKALREAADLKISIKTSFHRKSASEIPTPTKLPCLPSSSSTFCLAQTPKNHSSWNTSSLENTSQKSFNFDFFQPDKKYQQHILRLNEEIQILSDQLKQANELVKNLNEKLTETISKHVLHIQALQERHEQKLKRNQKELELILHSSNTVNHNELQKISNEFHCALERQQNEFESLMEVQEKRFKDEFEKRELEFKEKEKSLRQNFMTVIVDLKQKFIQELQEVKLKYKGKIKFLSTLRKKIPAGLASKTD